MKKIFIIFFLTLSFFSACKQESSSVTKIDLEVLSYIKSQTDFATIYNDSLPSNIIPCQTIVIEFLIKNKFNPSEYYVKKKNHTWIEDDKIYSDTSATHLSINLYHIDYFKIMLQDKKAYLKDSIIIIRKGNVGGKNFGITIDKDQKKVFGPHYWK